MSITKNDANTQSETNHESAQETANLILIEAMDAQIAEAVAQGVFWIMATVGDKNVNAKEVSQYYLDLGFGVEFLDVPGRPQPAILFGQNYVDYWLGRIQPDDSKLPYRIRLSWK